MVIIARTALEIIETHLRPGKVVLLLGARRTGKTFLLNDVLSNHQHEGCLLWNGEDFGVQDLLQRRSAAHYRELLQGIALLIIDEAQHVPEIGKILKLMVDSCPDLKVLVSGSSVFGLDDQTGACV